MPEIKLPAMSPTMEEGTLAKWLVKAGDTVKPGDVLAEIETDKATMELEADEGGVVEAIHVPEGSDGVKVGTLIATIRGEGDDATPRPPREELGVGQPRHQPQPEERRRPPRRPLPQAGGERIRPIPRLKRRATRRHRRPKPKRGSRPNRGRSPRPCR